MLTRSGITIEEITWLGPDALAVRFSSIHSTRHHQLYVGRRRMAETTSLTQRLLVAQVEPSRWPAHVQVVAIESSDIGIDRGDSLPPRPFNRARLAFNRDAWSGDPYELNVNRFALYRGAEPEGEIDYENQVAQVLAENGIDDYQLSSDPLPGSGEWNLGLLGIDPLGNAGTPAETTLDVVAYPPDFDDPFTPEVAAGVLSLTCTIPEASA